MTVRVLVAEYVTAGGLPSNEVPESLATEGRAMLEAVRTDFAALPRTTVVELSPGSSEDFDARFQSALHDCDAALVVAPEFDGILQRCHELVARSRVRWLGCDAEAIDSCTDKLRLHDRLVCHGIPTIPTLAGEPDAGTWPDSGRFVVKPRDGAGSAGIRVLDDPRDVAAALTTGDVVQPFVAGTPGSVSLIVRSSDDFDVLPVARQRLAAETLAYEGGRIPLPLDAEAERATQHLVRHLLQTIPGLRGFVGIDLLFPSGAPRQPVVVEVNPRLTTSYLGHRRRTRQNLAARLFDGSEAPVRWRDETIEFDPAGVEVSPGPVGRSKSCR